MAEGRDLKTIFAALKEQAKEEVKEVPDYIKNADRMPPPPIDPSSQEAKAVINAPSQAPPVTAPPVATQVNGAVNGAVNGTESTPQTNGESETNDTKQMNGSNIVQKVASDVKSGVSDVVDGADQVKNKLLGDLKKGKLSRFLPEDQTLSDRSGSEVLF